MFWSVEMLTESGDDPRLRVGIHCSDMSRGDNRISVVVTVDDEGARMADANKRRIGKP
jgi:hypothetical protein